MGYVHGYKDKTARIYFALHHLIVDAVSWRILIEDVRDLYYGEDLGSKTTSYREWIEAVKDYANENVLESKYWLEVQKRSEKFFKI